MNIFNPIAWKDFFEAWKEGILRRSKYFFRLNGFIKQRRAAPSLHFFIAVLQDSSCNTRTLIIRPLRQVLSAEKRSAYFSFRFFQIAAHPGVEGLRVGAVGAGQLEGLGVETCGNFPRKTDARIDPIEGVIGSNLTSLQGLVNATRITALRNGRRGKTR